MIDKQGLTYIPLSKILRTQFESQSSEAEGDYKGCPLISLFTKVDQKGKLFAFFCLALSLYNFGMYFIIFASVPATALFLYKISIIGGIMAVAFLLHFTIIHTNDKHHYMKYFYIFSLILVILALGNGFFTGVEFVENRYRETLGFGYYLFTFFVIFSYLFILARFIMHLKNSKKFEVKNRTKYLIVFLSILSLTVVLDMLRNADIFVLIDTLLMQYGIIIFASGVTYTIVKYKLLNINVIIEKSVLYSTIGIIVLLIFEIVKLVLEDFFQNILHLKEGYSAKVSVLVIAFLFEPIRNKTEKFFDKLFLGSK